MKEFGLFAFAAILVLGSNTAASAGNPASKAQAVVAASKRATGGAAWDKLTGYYEEGDHADGKVPYKTWLDFSGYGMRLESQRGGSRMVRGFNGQIAWQIGPDGAVKSSRDPAAIEEAILTDYISINGYYFPDRFPASFQYLRVEKTRERKFDVVEITPKGSRPFEIWFDHATHKVWHIVDRHGSEASTVEAGDYRIVHKVLIPFRLTVTGPDGTVVDRAAVRTVQFRGSDMGRFEPTSAP